MQLNDNIYDFNLQLDDGKNDWDSKKFKTLALSDSYSRLGLTRKASSVKYCGTYLEFKRFRSGEFKLHSANFCRVRLCPLCSWRRSLKIFSQVSRIMKEIDKSYQFIFLTLTCQNCTADDLPSTLDDMFSAFNRFNQRKVFKDCFEGWFRALEVTYNRKENTYHPHFHVVLCCKKSYFKKHYISQDQFSLLWQSCMRSKYKPIVHVRKFTKRKGVAESCKYTVKDSDYLTKKGIAMDFVVRALDQALAHRRLVAFGGLFKTIASDLLKLDDLENGDLVNVSGDDEINEDLEFVIEKYFWHVGFRSYYAIREEFHDYDNSYFEKRVNPNRLKYLTQMG